MVTKISPKFSFTSSVDLVFIFVLLPNLNSFLVCSMSLLQNPREHLLLEAEIEEESGQSQGWVGAAMHTH